MKTLHQPGECFLLQTNRGARTGKEMSHLCCIAFPLAHNPKCYVIAVCSSIKADRKYDPTVVLEVNCHSFITKPTFIDFSQSKTISDEEIANLESAGNLVFADAMPPDITQKIIDGFLQTDETPEGIKELARDLIYGSH